ncbi:MAG: acylphosphatase [Longimicrobiales bacterium]|nr:acylphosphatase [Longimicrobiales bacterium]
MANETKQEHRKGFRVTGRVQGVGFRWWTQKTASGLGLRGTVRNCADGSVEVHALGSSDSLESLEERLHEGPSSARVEGVEEIDPKSSLPDGFRIVR